MITYHNSLFLTVFNSLIVYTPLLTQFQICKKYVLNGKELFADTSESLEMSTTSIGPGNVLEPVK